MDNTIFDIFWICGKKLCKLCLSKKSFRKLKKEDLQNNLPRDTYYDDIMNIYMI